MEIAAKNLQPETTQKVEFENQEDFSSIKKVRDYPIKDPDFCKTRNGERAWEICQLCHTNREMGLVVGPSGCGKTVTGREYEKRSERTFLITADVTSKTIGSCLYLIENKLGFAVLGRSNTIRLHRLIEHLISRPAFLIIDEAHFLSWEAFEMIRKLHDCAAIGVAYFGMPILYTQMRGGNRSYLYDQIFSRIGIKVFLDDVNKADVSLIASSMCPDLDKKSLDFLYRKARGAGKYRGMVKLIKRALQIHNTEGIPLGIGLFKAANAFLVMGE